MSEDDVTTVHPVWVFYLQVYCPRCDTASYHGKCLTTWSHQGLPAVPVDFGADNAYDCPSCGAVICVGEAEVWTEDDEEDDAGEGSG